MEDNKTIRYLTGVLFALYAISRVYFNYYPLVWLFYSGYFASIIGPAIIAIACFIQIPLLLIIGASIYAVYPIRDIIWIITNWVESVNTGVTSPWEYLLFRILLLSYITLLLVKGIIKKRTKVLGIIAGCLLLVGFLYIWITDRIYYGMVFPSILDVIDFSFYICGAVLIGMTSFIKGPKISKSRINKQTETELIISKLDSLENIKTLLDKGIIDQEEFDQKKQQILNS